MKWKSKGPDVSYSSLPVSAYTFGYDKLNRMTLADYGSGYSGTYGDQAGYFNEQLTYDVMGNILTLNRNSSGNPMDNLSYAYAANSNKLLSVTDNCSNTAGFNDRNKSGDDYAYDASGNLTTDLNKGLTIGYNLLNLPKSVTRSDTTLGYTYDATGRKLKKTFPGQQDHYYIDGIEYDGSSLLFAMTEEGRVRPRGDGTYTYDYFLKDHLGNIRVVLGTDNSSGTNSIVYPAATMETMSAATESTYYSNLDKVRNVTPVGFTSLKKNEKVAHLKGTDPNKQIGPSITIKVNSGDKISLTAQSFYPDNTGSQRTGLAETALSQLVNAMINPAGLSDKGKAFATDNLKAQGFDKSSDYENLMNKLPNSDYNNDNNRPKAYMVWMLFDKEMKLVKTGQSSGARQIPEGAGQVKQMAESDIVMDQGGFLTAYTVNESPASVYIDNFQLSVVTGNVLEINDYYPFGMLNAGLSDPGYTAPLNYYKYNDKELQKELSLEWLDYGARYYDSQIGRWNNVDPLAEKYYYVNPYSYCADNPIIYVDKEGKEKIISLNPNKAGNPSIIKAANKYNDDGAIHVWAHGSSQSITIYDGKKEKTIASTKEFKKFLSDNSKIWQNRGKDDQVTIILHSCETGKESGNEPSFASKLSKDLENTTVIAPTEDVAVDNNTDTEMGSYSTKTVNEDGKEITVPDKVGQWRKFENGNITGGYSGILLPQDPSFFERLYSRTEEQMKFMWRYYTKQ